MRMIGIVAVMALLAGPASAQSPSIPKYGETTADKTPTEKAAEKDADAAYKRSLGNIPEQKSSDPWGAVRSDSAAPKAAAKAPAKPKAPKTETTAKQ